MTQPSGASPLRPLHKTQNLSMKEKRKQPAPSRWSGQGHYASRRDCEKRLRELAPAR
jgi:hypothetical protein